MRKAKSVTFTDFIILIKSIFLGLFLGISWILMRKTATDIILLIDKSSEHSIFRYLKIFIDLGSNGLIEWGITLLLLILVTLIFVWYTLESKLIDRIKILITSYRFDLLIYVCVGFFTAIKLNLGNILEKVLSPLGIELTTIEKLFSEKIIGIIGIAIIGLIIIFLGTPFFYHIKLRLIRKNKDDYRGFFLLDDRMHYLDEDLLDLKEKADSFSEKVLNNGADGHLVFGLDAPWGTGKSSFLEFCINEKWAKNNSVITYYFSPINYPNQTNIIEVFIDGMVSKIQEKVFLPELRPLVSRYSRLQREASRWPFNLLQIESSKFQFDSTLDDVFQDLINVLSYFPKNIIVVIDDLDRVSFSEVQNILFLIRKTLPLPKITYVVCYDSTKLKSATAFSDSHEICEYLEKFINVKFNLIVDKLKLKDFIEKQAAQEFENKLIEPKGIHEILSQLKNIYSSTEYLNYIKFIGDLRKLKRLINAIIMLGVKNDKIDSTDIDIPDLLHLLLIYIYFPDIFSQIYQSETGGTYGIFSARDEEGVNLFRRNEDNNGPKYDNSDIYKKLILELGKTTLVPIY